MHTARCRSSARRENQNELPDNQRRQRGTQHHHRRNAQNVIFLHNFSMARRRPDDRWPGPVATHTRFSSNNVGPSDTRPTRLWKQWPHHTPPEGATNAASCVFFSSTAGSQACAHKLGELGVRDYCETLRRVELATVEEETKRGQTLASHGRGPP